MRKKNYIVSKNERVEIRVGFNTLRECGLTDLNANTFYNDVIKPWYIAHRQEERLFSLSTFKRILGLSKDVYEVNEQAKDHTSYHPELFTEILKEYLAKLLNNNLIQGELRINLEKLFNKWNDIFYWENLKNNKVQNINQPIEKNFRKFSSEEIKFYDNKVMTQCNTENMKEWFKVHHYNPIIQKADKYLCKILDESKAIQHTIFYKLLNILCPTYVKNLQHFSIPIDNNQFRIIIEKELKLYQEEK